MLEWFVFVKWFKILAWEKTCIWNSHTKTNKLGGSLSVFFLLFYLFFFPPVTCPLFWTETGFLALDATRWAFHGSLKQDRSVKWGMATSWINLWSSDRGAASSKVLSTGAWCWLSPTLWLGEEKAFCLFLGVWKWVFLLGWCTGGVCLLCLRTGLCFTLIL